MQKSRIGIGAALLAAAVLWLAALPQAAQAAPMAKAAAAYYDAFESGASPDWDAWLAQQPRYYVYKENGRQGLLDAAGRTAVPPVYKEIADVAGDTVIVKNADYGLVRLGGLELTLPKYDSLRYDLAGGRFVGVKGKTEYYLDADGRVLGSAKYVPDDSAGDKDKKGGGQKPEPAKYAKNAFYPLTGGGRVLLAKGKFTVQDRAGKKLKTWHGLSLQRNIRGGFMLAQEEKFIFFDGDMRELNTVKALTCSELPNGVFEITRQKTGISVAGVAKSILSFGLDQAGGLADRWLNPGKKHNKRVIDKRGYVDNRGNEFVPTKFDYLGGFYNGRALVMDNDKFGYANERGGFDVPVSFSDISSFGLYDRDTVLVKHEGRIGFYQAGRGLLATGFADGRNFVNGLAAVAGPERKWGYIDKQGRLLIPYSFEEATPFYGRRAMAKRGGVYCIIDRSGGIVAELPGVQQASALRGGSALVKTGGRYGLVDEDGNFIKEAAYSSLKIFHDVESEKGIW